MGDPLSPGSDHDGPGRGGHARQVMACDPNQGRLISRAANGAETFADGKVLEDLLDRSRVLLQAVPETAVCA